MKTSDTSIRSRIEHILHLESKVKDICFKWSPNLGVYKSPDDEYSEDGDAVVTDHHTTGNTEHDHDIWLMVNDLLEGILINVIEGANDRVEENFGLLSALKEISGMVPPPPSLDWSLSESVLSSTPVNPGSKNQKKIHLHKLAENIICKYWLWKKTNKFSSWK